MKKIITLLLGLALALSLYGCITHSIPEGEPIHPENYTFPKGVE